MPRVRTARAIRPVAHLNLHAANVDLQSYPSENPTNQLTVPSEVLSHQLFSRPNARRVFRQRFGRSLDMDRIQIALNDAYRGGMRQLTDISRETVDVDPHLASVLNKRFGSLSSLPWEVQPATGVSVDSERAMFYAEVVREQLNNLNNFRKSLRQLAWALYDGRACLEIKWRQLPVNQTVGHPRFGRASWVIDTLAWIHPRRLSFGPRRQLQIENEEAGQSFDGNFAREGLQVDTLPNKFISWMPQLYAEYPEREGLAPKCLYWSFFKRFGARERMMLTELMGKPWRIIEVDQESTAGQPEMEAADEIVDALGASYTARLPRGTKLNVVQPGSNSGRIHADIIKSSDDQISKLVLGQTGTTDGTPAGLNNNQASVMQDEQLMILVGDAHELSEVIETLLTDRIIALNFGEDATPNAPKFRLRSDIPADRQSELKRLQSTLDAGISVKLAEAYEVSGFSQPDPESDVILRIEQPPTPPGAPNAPNPRPVIVFPIDASPAQGEQQPPPSTASREEGSRDDATADITIPTAALESVITVNEARASQNLPPLTLPDGELDPNGDLTITQFKTTKAPDTGEEEDNDPPEGGNGGPVPPPSQFQPGGEGGEEGEEETALEEEEREEIDEAEAQAARAQVQLVVRKEGNRYVVRSKAGRKLGDFATKEAADRRLRQIEFLKTQNATLRKMDAIAAELGLLDEDEVDPKLEFAVVESEGVFYVETKEGRRVASFATREEAEARRKQMEFFKAQGANAAPLIDALDDFGEVAAQQHDHCDHVHLATDFSQQSSATGNPEELVSRGTDVVAGIFVGFAKKYTKKVAGLDTPTAIFQAVNEVWEEIDVEPLAAELNQYMEQSLMMGALDGRAQQEGDLVRDQSQDIVDEQGATPASALEAFTADNVFTVTLEDYAGHPEREGIRINLATGDPIPDFGRLAFREATKFFKSLNVMSSATFEAASADVRRLSFTVAGNLSNQMVAVIQAELVRQIEKGASLVEFSGAMDARLKESGFLQTLQGGKMQASHVETVFRTNTLNAYNSGRARQALQPKVAQVFPVWEIRTATDKRVRDSHKALNGKKLLASDPFWRTSYPPFDYNCRCRVISRRSTRGVVEGSTLVAPGTGGFVSGTSSLI